METGPPIDNVSVFRPREYQFAPAYSVEMTESAHQVFDVKTECLSADENRMSFQLSAPGLGVILSPNLDLELTFKVKAPGVLDYHSAVGPILAAYDKRQVQAAAAQGLRDDDRQLGYTPKLAFSSGDAVFKNCTNYSVVVNGTSASNASFDKYKRSLDKCYLSEDTWKTRYAMAGGPYQKYDCRPVSGEAYLGGAINQTVRYRGHNQAIGGAAQNIYTPIPSESKVVAWTGDSGVDARVRGLLACIVKVEPGDALDIRPVYTIKVRSPVSGVGLFTPLTPDDYCASSCPLKKSLYALANMNNVQFDFLFEDLIKGLFRDLSTRENAATGILAANRTAGTLTGYDIQLDTTNNKPTLHSRWMRLHSWRNKPARITASLYRNTVHKASSYVVQNPVEIPQAILDGPALPNCLVPVGSGIRANDRVAQQNVEGAADGRYGVAEWKSIQAAQAPQYLFFCLQKSSKVFTNVKSYVDARISRYDTLAAGEPIAAGNAGDTTSAGVRNYQYARQQDANAAIVQFELEIQSSVGAYRYSSESTYPYLKTRQQLWRDTIKNTISDYCSNEIDLWFKNDCALLLHSSDWLRGLTSPNTAFPIIFNAKIRFESRREFIDGQAAAAKGFSGPAVMHDMIVGDPVMVMCYPNMSMTISSSSAAVSSANFSHQQASGMISGRMPMST